MSNSDSQVLSHHVKQEYCENREKYRNGKKLRAVKVYTINDESTYLIITKVQAIKLEHELFKVVRKKGKPCVFRKLENYPTESFEEAYLIKYKTIEKAKKAKKFLDEKDFFGSMLHVFYAPEYETQDEVAAKLTQRTGMVLRRLQTLRKEAATIERKRNYARHLQKQASQQKDGPSTSDTKPIWQASHTSDVMLSKPKGFGERYKNQAGPVFQPRANDEKNQSKSLKRTGKGELHKSNKRLKQTHSFQAHNRMPQKAATSFVPRSVNQNFTTPSTSQENP